MNFHEISKIYPLIDGVDFEDLVEDIKNNGLHEPILAYKGLIIDGRNRFNACMEADVKPIFKEWDGNGSLADLIVSLNEKRRHLTASQRGMVAENIKPFYEAEAKTRQHAGVPVLIPEGAGDTRDKVASKFHISGKYVDMAGKVKKQGSQELIDGVTSGKISLPTASVLADVRPEDQRNIVALTEREVLLKAKEIKSKKRLERITARKEQKLSLLKEHHPLNGEKYKLFHNDFRKVEIENDSIDHFVTDPPYPAEYLDLYKDLSIFAADKLKPGGSLIVMCGQSHLPTVINNLTFDKRLTYQWMLGYYSPGQSSQIFGRHVKSNWKPLIWLVKGKYEGEHVDDVIKSDANDKRFHEWGQSVSGMVNIIERFTTEGELIVDPFAGASTTGCACVLTNRIYIGIDIDEANIQQSAKRLQDATR
jgi:hypothetical protein